MREKRRHPRFSCVGTAEVHHPWAARPYPARVKDLSVTGCKLVLLAEAAIEPRSIFELTFTVNRIPFRVHARATGVRGPDGLGVEFVSLTLTATQNLYDLIDELAEKQRMVLR